MLLLAACGEVSGSVGGGLGPTASQALELSLAVTDEVESAAAGLVLFGSPPGWSLPAGCPVAVISGDTDSDGIPDDASFTYTAPPCIAPFRRGSIALTGLLEVEDTDLGAAGAWRLTYDDLRWSYEDSTGPLDYAAIRNGTRTRTGTTTTAQVVTDVEIVRSRPNRTDATVDWAGTTTFTAKTAGTLIPGNPPPDGDITVTGTLSWHRSTEHWTLTVATPTPLVYDKDCVATPRIVGGQLTLTGTIAGEDGVLLLTWNECGVRPVATWIAN